MRIVTPLGQPKADLPIPAALKQRFRWPRVSCKEAAISYTRWAQILSQRGKEKKKAPQVPAELPKSVTNLGPWTL